MFPSGRKASKLYSQKPIDGSADLTVTRASVANEINSDGLIEEVAANVPRFEYGVGVTCQSLLLQPASENLLTYPLSFDNGYWTKANVSVTSGQSAPSVDNPTGAFKFIDNSSSASHGMYRLGVSGATGTYTFSIILKASQIILAAAHFGTFSNRAEFDLSAGTYETFGGVDSASMEFLVDGWYICTVTDTFSGSDVYVQINNLLTSGTSSYTGDGVSGIEIFAAQLEEQSYPTSLMLPVSEGSTTSRAVPVVNKTSLTNYIGQTAGVIFVDVIKDFDFGIQIGNTTGSTDFHNSIQIVIGATQTDINIYLSNSLSFTYSGAVLTGRNKIAVAYSLNDFALYINGSQTLTDSSGDVPVMSGIFFNHANLGTKTCGLKSLKIYKTRLINSELATLTTL